MKHKNMRYFLIEYTTLDGEHEYTERGVTAAINYDTAEKYAKKGLKYFYRYGWEEFCEVSNIREIPKNDFKILKKHFIL
jgi:hypothetical protein